MSDEAPTKGRKKGLPKVHVDLPVESQKKPFTLQLPTLKLLAEYAAFLSQLHRVPIDEDRVLEGLIRPLERDRSFVLWKKGKTNA